MSPNFKYLISITIFLVACAIAFPGCTTVSVKHPNGLHISIRKFHPMGEQLNIDGVLKDVGTLKVNKTTKDSQEAVDAIVDGLLAVGRNG